MSEQEGKLSPDDYAESLHSKNIVFTLVHDSNIFRLNLRLQALINVGYRIQTNLVSHSIKYNDDGKITITDHLCIGVFHPELSQRIISQNARESVVHNMEVS